MASHKLASLFLTGALSLAATSVFAGGDVQVADPGSDIQMNFGKEGGIVFSTADGATQMQIGGYFNATAAGITGDKKGDTSTHNLYSGTNIPTARAYISGIVNKDWYYNFTYEFASDKNAIKNAYVGYTGFNHLDLRAGQYKTDFSISNMTSYPAQTFIERPAPVLAFGLGFNIGGQVRAYTDTLNFSASVFGPGSNGSANNVGITDGDDPIGFASRFFYSPIHTADRMLHLGAAAYYRDTGKNEQVRYRAVPDYEVRGGHTLVDTAVLNNSQDVTSGVVEAAGTYGSFSAQGEYYMTHVSRHDGYGNPTFKGGYAQASYFLTGEKRVYNSKSGAFTGISPVEHSYGAWQVAARVSNLDLNDKGVQGGDEMDYVLGLNWYPNNHVRFAANYVRADADNLSYSKDRDVNIFALMAQVVL